MRIYSELQGGKLKLSSVLEENSSPSQKSTNSNQQGNYIKSILPLTLILFFFVVLKNAWLGDDSYITFRTVDNIIHGYGLTWNTDEPFQPFTHPLSIFLFTFL